MLNFEYEESKLKDIANTILTKAKILGATSAQLEINEAIDINVDVLNANIENFETSYSRSLTLVTYIGKKKGAINTSQINNIDEIIAKALDIANYTQEDLANGIAERESICQKINNNLQLYNPVEIDNITLIEKAKSIEDFISDKQIKSDGASISLSKYNFLVANSNGLNLGYKTTRYSNSISLIGNTKAGTMQTDYWYSSSREFNELESAQTLSIKAQNRLRSRLVSGKIVGGKYPVIFDSPIAKSLIASALNAISGSNLYRGLTFLTNSIDSKIFPSWLNIEEDPFIIKGQASCYFDTEGVKVSPRSIVDKGTIKGYLLNCYTARKLNLITTGNGGGAHNIHVTSNVDGDINTLAQKIIKGLIIVETIGHGLNMVTGDYSVGASGLWLENGEIQFFVENITISGNLKTMFSNIQYIANDYNNSAIKCGSMLIDEVQVSV